MAPAFAGAPLTRVLLATSVLLSLISFSEKVAASLYLDDRSQIFSARQLWRLLTSLLPFESVAEAAVGWMLLYRFGRNFERLMGRAKFATFVAMASVGAVGARIGILASLPASEDRVPIGGGAPLSWLHTGLASGPYHIIFGLLPLYYAYVPALTPTYFKLAGLKFSEKAGTYALAAALACCTGQRSLLTAIYSLGFGLVYALPGPGRGLQAVILPRFLRDVIGSFVLPLIGDDGTTLSPLVSPRASANDGGTSSGPSSSPRPSAPQREAPVGLGPEPSADLVERLMSMGFTRDDVVLALRRSWGSEERAVEMLLGGIETPSGTAR